MATLQTNAVGKITQVIGAVVDLVHRGFAAQRLQRTQPAHLRVARDDARIARVGGLREYADRRRQLLLRIGPVGDTRPPEVGRRDDFERTNTNKKLLIRPPELTSN